MHFRAACAIEVVDRVEDALPMISQILPSSLICLWWRGALRAFLLLTGSDWRTWRGHSNDAITSRLGAGVFSTAMGPSGSPSGVAPCVVRGGRIAQACG